MSLSLSSSNNPSKPTMQQGLRSGAEGQQSASTVLPQSNGVNITIINPTTNVMSCPDNAGCTANAKLTPNPPDSFTPSTMATSPATPTMQALPMASLPPAGGLGY